MGMSSAYYLKKNNPNKRILVIDRFDAPGKGNTERSNATFRNVFSSPDNQVLSNSTIDFFLHVQDDLEVDLNLQKVGYLRLMDEEQLSTCRPVLKLIANNGIEFTEYGKEDLRRLLPGVVTDFGSNEDARMMELPPVDGGILGAKCGRLDAEKLISFYTKEFVRAGGMLAFDQEVKSLALTPPGGRDAGGGFDSPEFGVEGVYVHGVADETLRAETVVLAGGAWENELLERIGLSSNVKSKKRQLFSIRTKGTKLEGLLHSSGFNPLGLVPITVLPKAGVHFNPANERDVLLVECEDEVNRPFIDLPEHNLEAYTAESKFYERNIYPVLVSYFPDFRDLPIHAMWAGLYAYNALDYLPFAFRQQNLIVVGGDSGGGMMKGDSLGRIVDSLYREQDETMLYGEVPYRTSKLSFEKRDVQREEWVI
jgi:FAD-dependent oxidoreductase domain-containing protein 1